MNERRGEVSVAPFRKRQSDDLVAQIHYHSAGSDGFGKPQKLVDSAIRKGVNFFALTDHDCIDGSYDALNYATRFNLINLSYNKDHFQVEIGEEVTTLEAGGNSLSNGVHLLVIGVKEYIPCLLTAEETAIRAREQGALVIIPHPGFSQAEGMSWTHADEMIDKGLVDGVEIWNGAQETLSYMSYIVSNFPGGKWLADKLMLEDDTNIKALEMYLREGIGRYAVIGGQDGHLASDESLTKVVTLYPMGMDFFEAVKNKQTSYSTEYKPEFWGVLMYLLQGKMSRRLEDDRQNNRNGIMCVR